MKKQRIYIFVIIGILIWNCLFFFKQSLVNAQSSSNFQPNFTPISSSLIANSNYTEEDFEDFSILTQDMEKIEGLFTIYENEKKGTVYVEIKPDQLNQNFLWLTTLSSGIGEGLLLSGMPIHDFLFQFRQGRDQIQITLPNIRFRGEDDLPLPKTFYNSFGESTIYSTPILSINPDNKGVLIDLSSVLLTGQDLTFLTSILPYMLGGTYINEPQNSSISEVKVFPNNLEVNTLRRFSSLDPFLDVPVLPDSNNFNLNIHYSIAAVPNNNYRPRLADNRIGYFITAYQDLSNHKNTDSFVRYIERWNLEPSDPNATLSPPKEPIVFWLDNAIPEEYRETVAEGVKAWNKAFEKIGFLNAIEVKQMPRDADWDPADSRYNTIIWSAMFQSGLLGVGPSHVNPLTGQILDADVIINADAIRFAKQEFTDLSQFAPSQGSLNLCGDVYRKMWGKGLSSLNSLKPSSITEEKNKPLPAFLTELMARQDYCYGLGSVSQFNQGKLAMNLLDYITPNSEKMEEYIKQFIFDLVAHEVGHTLGLRHNFHGSTLRNTSELNDVELTRNQGSVGSVMDYTAVNLAPPGMTQGDYYPTTIGPYDEWAIAYGYQPSGIRFPAQERNFLNTIAQRSPEKELAYATDEDAWGFEDPNVNLFDLGGDILNYAQGQMDNANLMWKKLETYYPGRNETYSDIRQKFNTILSYYLGQIWVTQKYIGGRHFNRDHPDGPNSRLPFQSVSLAEQKEALDILAKYFFAKDSFSFSKDLLNRLAPSRWNHWGQSPGYWGLDYPVYDLISFFQRDLLWWLLSDYRLNQLKDMATKTDPQEILPVSQLMSTLDHTVWKEILEPDPENVNLVSLRRSLQREHLDILIAMILRKTTPPEDARSVAWYELREIKDKVNGFLGKYGNQLDLDTKAHLTESSDRITKALSAQIQSN
jgi:hypothetical protein